MPTLHVQEICFSLRRNTWVPTLRIRFVAQTSMSRAVPRSINNSSVPSPKRPNKSDA